MKLAESALANIVSHHLRGIYDKGLPPSLEADKSPRSAISKVSSFCILAFVAYVMTVDELYNHGVLFEGRTAARPEAFFVALFMLAITAAPPIYEFARRSGDDRWHQLFSVGDLLRIFSFMTLGPRSLLACNIIGFGALWLLILVPASYSLLVMLSVVFFEQRGEGWIAKPRILAPSIFLAIVLIFFYSDLRSLQRYGSVENPITNASLSVELPIIASRDTLSDHPYHVRGVFRVWPQTLLDYGRELCLDRILFHSGSLDFESWINCRSDSAFRHTAYDLQDTKRADVWSITTK